MSRDARASVTPRRPSSGLDPNGSSVRRMSVRRSSAPPRVVPRPASIASELPAAPRNRRVPRAARAPSGPTFAQRTWELVLPRVLAVWARMLAWRPQVQRPSGASSLILRVFGACCVLALALGLGRFLLTHLTTAPAFAIDNIAIKGSTRLERAELLSAAGIDIGTNVFARSPDEVRGRLQRHPWILDAQVSRTLPSHFEITVQERQPVAIMAVEACGAGAPRIDDDPACEEANALYLISGEAKLFKRVGGKDPVDLPVITGVTRKRFTDDPDFQKRIVVDAIALLGEYRSSGLWQQSPIGEIHLEANDGLSLYVGDDLTYVRLGAPPFAPKLRRMKRVFERLEREHARAEYIYLDNEQHPDRVAVRLR